MENARATLPGVGVAHWLAGAVGTVGLAGLMGSKTFRDDRDAFANSYREAALFLLAVAAAWILVTLLLDRRVLRKAWAWDLGAAAGVALLLHAFVRPPSAEFDWTPFFVSLSAAFAALVLGVVALALWWLGRSEPQWRMRRAVLLQAYGAMALSAPLWILVWARRI